MVAGPWREPRLGVGPWVVHGGGGLGVVTPGHLEMEIRGQTEIMGYIRCKRCTLPFMCKYIQKYPEISATKSVLSTAHVILSRFLLNLEPGCPGSGRSSDVRSRNQSTLF